MDRIDLQIDVPAVTPADLALPPAKEGTTEVAARILAARTHAHARNGGCTNADLRTDQLDHVAVSRPSGSGFTPASGGNLGVNGTRLSPRD